MRNDHIISDEVKEQLRATLPAHTKLLNAFKQYCNVTKLSDAIYASLYFNYCLGGTSERINLYWLDANLHLLPIHSTNIKRRVFTEVRNSRPWLPPFLYCIPISIEPCGIVCDPLIQLQMNKGSEHCHYWSADLPGLLARFYRTPEYRDDITFYRIPTLDILKLPYSKRRTMFGLDTPAAVEESMDIPTPDLNFETYRVHEEYGAFTNVIPDTAIGYHLGPVAAPAVMALLALCGSEEDSIKFKSCKRIYGDKARCRQLEEILDHILGGEAVIADNLLPLFESAHACGCFKPTAYAAVNHMTANNYDCATGKSIWDTYLDIMDKCAPKVGVDKSFSYLTSQFLVDASNMPKPDVSISDVLGGYSKERILPFYHGIYTINDNSINCPSLLTKEKPVTKIVKRNRGVIPTL